MQRGLPYLIKEAPSIIIKLLELFRIRVKVLFIVMIKEVKQWQRYIFFLQMALRK